MSSENAKNLVAYVITTPTLTQLKTKYIACSAKKVRVPLFVRS